MAIHSEALRHAKEVAAQAVSEAVKNIDKEFELPDYAANHPELVKAYMELFLAVYQTNQGSGNKI